MPLIINDPDSAELTARAKMPLHIERHGNVWLLANPEGINCVRGPGGSVLFSSEANAERALARLCP